MADFVISVSYGNYLIQNGGTDKVIREHQEMFSERGIDYIFLFPVIRRIKIGKFEKTFRYWGIDKNKEFIGLYEIDGVLNYISNNMALGNRCRGFFIHHLWRVEAKELKKVLSYVKAPIYFYLHDYYLICDNKNLLNEKGSYCGYGLNCFQCNKECEYYLQSEINREILIKLIKTFKKRLVFIAPSFNTRNIYKKTFPQYGDLFISLPHQKMIGIYKKQINRDKIKVAFVGKQVPIKGWNDYKVIVNALKDSPNFEFYYFGTDSNCPTNVKSVYVSVKDQGNDAMVKALRKNGIDIVLLLSNSPETYSYTYYESFSAGCYIVTYKCSGNMADMVVFNENGIVLNNVDEVLLLFNDCHRLQNELQKHNSSNIDYPLELVPNDQIIDIALKKKFVVNESIKTMARKKKRYVFSLIYIAINRRKLNVAKNNI